jgi:NADH:ubiquinone oxidoreductase subunit H
MLLLLFIVGLIYHIILMLASTLTIAALTLVERKALSVVQRRVGPNFVGYRGRLQYIADALKLLTKGTLIPDGVSLFWFILVISVSCTVCYSFWGNTVWGPSLSIFEIEYNLVYATLLSMIFSFCIIMIGYFSKNKYAIMASIRCAVLTINLEIFLGLMMLTLVVISGSFCFSTFVIYQELNWNCITFAGIFGLVIITFLLEANRAPFDLAEAESELVAGYSVEIGGFYFALYYLGEYFHLFFFSSIVSILFFGGWEYPNFSVWFSESYKLI